MGQLGSEASELSYVLYTQTFTLKVNFRSCQVKSLILKSSSMTNQSIPTDNLVLVFAGSDAQRVFVERLTPALGSGFVMRRKTRNLA